MVMSLCGMELAAGLTLFGSRNGLREWVITTRRAHHMNAHNNNGISLCCGLLFILFYFFFSVLFSPLAVYFSNIKFHNRIILEKTKQKKIC